MKSAAVAGESLSDSDRTRLCSIVGRVVGRLIVDMRDEQSQAARPVTSDQVVPQRGASVESRSTRTYYCPADDEAQSSRQDEGFYVRPTQTIDGLEVFDRNRRFVRTINASEHCDTPKNPITRNRN